MKKFLTTLSLAVMILFAGCVDLDDIYRRLDEQARELATVKALVNAINEKISVTSYIELSDKSGYELIMSDGSKIVLKHGAQGAKGDKGDKGDQGNQGNDGQDGDANLTITETDDFVIITYKGVTYTISKDVPPVMTVTLTTEKPVGSTIGLLINAAEADRPDVWIDLNNNGKKDTGEAVTNFDLVNTYTLGAKVVTVYGEITLLYCDKNQLTSIDVSNNIALKYLYCRGNQLTSLDVSNNTALRTLCCENNHLTSLDLSNNTALKRLYCNENQLTSLDLSNITALELLSCQNNHLTSLDLSNITALELLYCYNNLLTSLDVSNKIALEHVYCSNNQLTSLDVSNNTALELLYCYNNLLTSLDVSNNTALKRLSCQENNLTSITLNNNTELEDLFCFYNKISSSNMNLLVNSLPDRLGREAGEFRVFGTGFASEQNVITAAQAAVAKGKNWSVQDESCNPYTPGS